MDKHLEKQQFFFTVVVTVYNFENYIIETLESINAQTFSEYEVLIIDDCSTDGSSYLIEKFIENKNNWTLYKNEINRGVVYCRNKVFSLAGGKFIAALDGDDVWYKDKLYQQHQILSKGNIDFCYTSYTYINQDSRKINFIYKTKKEAKYKSLLMENYIGYSTAVISNEISKNIKMKENHINEDFVYWLQVLKDNYVGIGILQPLVKYRIHENGRSFNKIKAAKNRYMIYQKNEKLSLTATMFYFLNYAFKASMKFVNIYRYSLKNKGEH